MNVDLDKVIGRWSCPECEKEIDVSYTNIADVGNPVCSDCDSEMELVNSIGEYSGE